MHVLETRFTKFKSRLLMPASSQLIAEIELMNIMVKHKMPLSAFSSIMNWAKECSEKHHHNFSQATIWSWTTIFSEFSSNLQLISTILSPWKHIGFKKNASYKIFVRSFPDVLYSLLTKWWVDAWRQSYLSSQEHASLTPPLPKDPKILQYQSYFMVTGGPVLGWQNAMKTIVRFWFPSFCTCMGLWWIKMTEWHSHPWPLHWNSQNRGQRKSRSLRELVLSFVGLKDAFHTSSTYNTRCGLDHEWKMWQLTKLLHA